MVKTHVFSGQLNSRVEFFENTSVSNEAGESVVQKTSIGSRMVKRVDALGGEEEDGRLIGLQVCRFQMRYDNEIFAKSSTLIVTDFDGDWLVVAPASLLSGRRRYMELKCRKRGEN